MLSPPLATVATEFLSRPELSPNTVQSYELTLIPLLAQYGKTPIDRLTRQQLKQYLDSLDKIKYATHNRHQATLNALLNFATKEGYCQSNPLQGIPRRKPAKQKGEHLEDDPIRYLTPQQLQTLYQTVKDNPRLNAIVYLLHRSGARIQEILNLDLNQLDSQNRKFKVIGKGNKTRWCFYSQDAAQALQKYIRFYRAKDHKALFTACHPLTKKITRLSYDTVHNDWQNAIAQSSELIGIRLHDLRHTFATERVGLMGIEELRALMGHASIQTTLRYQKVTSARAEEVAQIALSKLTHQ